MNYIEKRANLWYATLTIPTHLRASFGKAKFVQSTGTDSKPEASLRAAVLVADWKSQIAKARGSAPNPKDSFWDSLRKDYQNAQDMQDEGLIGVIEDLAATMAAKESDAAQSAQLYATATGQSTPLAPLVGDWVKSLRGAQKTIDQRNRDMSRVAGWFISLEALKPQKVKVWIDQQLKEGVTHSSFIRIGGTCRAFWAYLQMSGTVSMLDADPFEGAFKLALKVATRTVTGRSGSAYTPVDLAKIYSAALVKGDQPLADLIALGAYTGARIEELGRLTRDTCKDGVFTIGRSKTAAGVRQVPIHPAVAPLVARMLEASKDGYLVPSSANNQYGNRTGPAGKRYGHLKKALGFGENLVFHSTRNTLVTLMDQAGVPEGVSADTVGHAKKTMTYGLYSGGSSMAQKLGAISKVAYPGELANP